MAHPITRQSLAIGLFAEVRHKGGRGGRFIAEIVAHVPQSRLVVGRNLDTGRTTPFTIHRRAGRSGLTPHTRRDT